MPLRKAGTVPSTGVRYGPGSAAHHAAKGRRAALRPGHVSLLDSDLSNPDKALTSFPPKEISMSLPALESTINTAFDARDGITTATKGEVRDAVDHALDLLDKGEARVAEREASGKWKVNQWLKKAVLLSFRLNDMSAISGGPGNASWWDKVPSKFDGWGENRFRDAGFRAVPGAIVRRSAFIAKNVVLMPSFVNLGAYVDESTMIDTWSTVGSCAQIGKRVHISGGVGIGGVLEPLQAEPVIVEDDCFIGARSEVAEGVIVRKGAVLAMGVFLGQSTKIVDRQTGKIHIGEVPEYAVVVPGSMPGKPLPDGSPGPSLACAVIVKTVDEQTRSKTSINELLRD
jgi:2,3,4,5-tetrahydropyridine-2-carboxylate N-succinyltransferase